MVFGVVWLLLVCGLHLVACCVVVWLFVDLVVLWCCLGCEFLGDGWCFC